MDRRFLLTAALCFGILFVWQNYVQPPPKKKPAPKPQAASAPAIPGKPASAPTVAACGGEMHGRTAPAAMLEEKTASLDTPLFTADVSSKGGGLRQVTLKEYKEGGQRRGEEKFPVHLVGASPQPIAAAVLDVAGQPFPFSSVTKSADTIRLHGDSAGLSVDATWQPAPHQYMLAYEGTIKNTSEQPVQVQLDLQMNGLYNEGKVKERSMFDPPADAALPLFFDGSSMHRHAPGKSDTPQVKQVAWAGIDRQYFLIAAAPIEPAARSASFSETRVPEEQSMVRMQALLSAQPETIAPGQTLKFRYLVYAGPKASSLLRAPERRFEEVTEYSFLGLPLGFLARPMLWFLNRAHDTLHNWGLAIIALTLLLKIILFPVTVRSVKSMQVMRELKPELDKIKARFPGDREKQGVETMRLYRERKVNPLLSGCLPALLQMPVWVAMWRTIAGAVELYQKDFLWVADLTARDPFYILPLINGALMFVQQKITPPAGDPEQQKMMMYIMPPMFTLIMINLPSGVVFYSVVNAILTILQQTYITRRLTNASSAGAQTT